MSSVTMNYAILSEAARNAALTELIPADLRAAGVFVEASTPDCFTVAWDVPQGSRVYHKWIKAARFDAQGDGEFFTTGVAYVCSVIRRGRIVKAMNYDMLPTVERNAALAELIPADLRGRGVYVVDSTPPLGNFIEGYVWLGGGGFYYHGKGATLPEAVECACKEIYSRIGEAR